MAYFSIFFSAFQRGRPELLQKAWFYHDPCNSKRLFNLFFRFQRGYSAICAYLRVSAHMCAHLRVICECIWAHFYAYQRALVWICTHMCVMARVFEVSKKKTKILPKMVPKNDPKSNPKFNQKSDAQKQRKTTPRGAKIGQKSVPKSKKKRRRSVPRKTLKIAVFPQ